MWCQIIEYSLDDVLILRFKEYQTKKENQKIRAENLKQLFQQMLLGVYGLGEGTVAKITEKYPSMGKNFSQLYFFFCFVFCFHNLIGKIINRVHYPKFSFPFSKNWGIGD